MRRLARAILALTLGLFAAACDVAPPPTATPLPLPTDVPTPSAPMQQYAGDGYVIDYPETWVVVTSEHAGDAVYFGPDAARGPLGMAVHRVDASRRAPDALLDAYRDRILATVPDASYSDDRMDAPNGGRSDYYQDWRAEPRLQYQVTFYVGDEATYRVEQWSPVRDWDRLWVVLFEAMLKGFAFTERAP